MNLEKTKEILKLVGAVVTTMSGAISVIVGVKKLKKDQPEEEDA